MEIKKLREIAGLSQARFGEKYGIPTRTIEEWEAERRTAPAYVVEWLTKIVKMEEVNMKAWIFYEYRDSRGTGSTKLFKTQQEAEEYAKNEWDHMNEYDKKSYLADPAGAFHVAEVLVEWDEDDEDWIPDLSAYTPTWDALKEARKGEVVSDIIDQNEGDYDDIEVYEYTGGGTPHFHTDSIRSVELKESKGLPVKAWELMDEEAYQRTIAANSSEDVDFGEWYDDKEAKVLCILI